MYKSLLEQFEESGKEVYQVTKNEWINIMNDHYVNVCGYTQENFNTYDKIEVECFHSGNVKKALENNLIVSEEVLKDYAELKEKVEIEKKKDAESPRLTKDIFNILNIGDKIKVNNYKLTVHEKDNNSLTLRLYKSRTKAIQLFIGDKANISIGWN